MNFKFGKNVLGEISNTRLKRKKLAFEFFKKVCDNSLGKQRSEKYVQVANDLLCHYYYMPCIISLNIHVLYYHLDNLT